MGFCYIFEKRKTLNFNDPMSKICTSLYFYKKSTISKVTHFTLLTHFTPLYPICSLTHLQATDNGVPAKSDTADLQVDILDTNDNR